MTPLGNTRLAFIHALTERVGGQINLRPILIARQFQPAGSLTRQINPCAAP